MNKVLALAALLVCLAVAAPAFAQEAPAPAQPEEAAEHAPVAAGTADEAQELAHGAEGAEEEHHGGIADLLWPTANFLVLAGILYYFLKDPLVGHLKSRHTNIRKDLVEAAELKAAATAQLAEIDRKLKALPGEIEALRTRGAEEIAAEEQRIADQAAAERERLLEQTRREIDLQLRIAKHELVEHAADLAVGLATDRIRQEMKPGDQDRLVDRYLDQVKKHH